MSVIFIILKNRIVSQQHFQSIDRDNKDELLLKKLHWLPIKSKISLLSTYYQLRQLLVVRKSLSTKACEALVHAFVSSIDSTTATACCMVY